MHFSHSKLSLSLYVVADIMRILIVSICVTYFTLKKLMRYLMWGSFQDLQMVPSLVYYSPHPTQAPLGWLTHLHQHIRPVKFNPFSYWLQRRNWYILSHTPLKLSLWVGKPLSYCMWPSTAEDETMQYNTVHQTLLLIPLRWVLFYACWFNNEILFQLKKKCQ